MNCWEQRYQDGETGWDRGGLVRHYGSGLSWVMCLLESKVIRLS